jgi:ribonuclease VapC
MIVAVLDASALLALLLGEPGKEKVREVLAESAISVVNFGEVAGLLARSGMPPTSIRQVLDPLPSERVAMDEELAYAVGFLLPVTKSAGLSFGDRACLALALRLGVRALTADKNWSGVASAAGVTIELIR